MDSATAKLMGIALMVVGGLFFLGGIGSDPSEYGGKVHVCFEGGEDGISAYGDPCLKGKLVWRSKMQKHERRVEIDIDDGTEGKGYLATEKGLRVLWQEEGETTLHLEGRIRVNPRPQVNTHHAGKATVTCREVRRCSGTWYETAGWMGGLKKKPSSVHHIKITPRR